MMPTIPYDTYVVLIGFAGLILWASSSRIPLHVWTLLFGSAALALFYYQKRNDKAKLDSALQSQRNLLKTQFAKLVEAMPDQIMDPQMVYLQPIRRLTYVLLDPKAANALTSLMERFADYNKSAVLKVVHACEHFFRLYAMQLQRKQVHRTEVEQMKELRTAMLNEASSMHVSLNGLDSDRLDRALHRIVTTLRARTYKCMNNLSNAVDIQHKPPVAYRPSGTDLFAA